MNKGLKTTFSILLIAIMAFISISLPIFQSSYANDVQASVLDSVQDVSLEVSEGLFFVFDKDQSNLSIQKVKGHNPFNFLFPDFSIQVLHNLQVSKIIALSKEVVINLSISKLIFPFAYFW